MPIDDCATISHDDYILLSDMLDELITSILLVIQVCLHSQNCDK